MTMKKYVKPELFYEQFELSTHVAACTYDHKGTLVDTHTCTYVSDDTGWVFYAGDNAKCDWTPEDIGGDNNDCYFPGSNESVGIILLNS